MRFCPVILVSLLTVIPSCSSREGGPPADVASVGDTVAAAAGSNTGEPADRTGHNVDAPVQTHPVSEVALTRSKGDPATTHLLPIPDGARPYLLTFDGAIVEPVSIGAGRAVVGLGHGDDVQAWGLLTPGEDLRWRCEPRGSVLELPAAETDHVVRIAHYKGSRAGLTAFLETIAAVQQSKEGGS